MVLEALAYHRGAVADGECWRLATAVLAHLSIGHLLLNGAGLAVVVALLRRLAGAPAIAAAFIASAVATTAGIHLASPLDWYAGASSATLGLLAWGCAQLRRPVAAVALGLLIIGALADLDRTRSLLGEPVAPLAHLFGIAGGLGWALAGRLGGGIADRLRGLRSRSAPARPAVAARPRRCARSAPGSD